MAQIKSENLDTLQRCRACLITGGDMFHLLEKNTIENRDMTNLEVLQECTFIEVSVTELWPQYLCKDCMRRANESYIFKVQYENSQKILADEFEKCQQREIPEDKFPCSQCHKEFNNHTSLMKHRRKHNIALHSCAYCETSTTSASLLARHMDDKHSDMKSMKCVHCDKTFFKRANLRLHLKVHLGIKRHMCEICGISFALAGNLVAHKRLHTGLKPYVCKQCNRGFAQQAALRSHEAGHSDLKEHVCTECGAAFSRAGALRNHKKRHLPERPFVCSVCGKAFTFSYERKRHMTIHTGEKNHECDICGSRFNRRTNLSVHRRIHTGETPHVCSVCGKRFNQAHCLRTHMASHGTN